MTSPEMLNDDQELFDIKPIAKDVQNLDIGTDNFDTSSFWKTRDETQQHSLKEKIFHIARLGLNSELKAMLDRELPETIPIPMPIQSDDNDTSTNDVVNSLTSKEPFRLDLDIIDNSGWSPLIHASFNGHLEIVKEIIDYQEKKLKYEYKQEMIKDENDNKKILKYKHAFKLFICRHVNWNGSTALHLSCAKGHELIVKFLLNKMLFGEYEIDHKLSINTVDYDQATPLHCAVLGKHYNIVEMLLINNAMTDQTDIRGKTAYDWAKERNMTKYVQLFQKYRNVSIDKPVIDDKDIPAKVVESIWEDHERKSMEPSDANNSHVLPNMLCSTTPSPSSPDDINVNIINISQSRSQTPGPGPGPGPSSSQNGWYQGTSSNNNNNNSSNWNGNNNNNNYHNNWNHNNNRFRYSNTERQRAPRHIRYEQRQRSQYNSFNAWNQNNNNWNHNGIGYNPRWNNNNNRWNSNNRWNGNGNGNNQRWNSNGNGNGNGNWSQRNDINPALHNMCRHQSYSPEPIQNISIPPPLSISKSWDPCYNQQSDQCANTMSSAVKSQDEEEHKDDTGSVKIRDKILAAEQKQLEKAEINGHQEEIKLDIDVNKDKEIENVVKRDNNKDLTMDAIKFRNKYLSARCDRLEKENEILKKLELNEDKDKSYEYDIEKNKESLKQLNVKQTQIHELRHTMRKMRKFIDTLPIELRRNFYKDNGNFSVNKEDENENENENGGEKEKEKEKGKDKDKDKDKEDDQEKDVIKHRSKGWKTTSDKNESRVSVSHKNDNKIYRNNQRKYGRNKRRNGYNQIGIDDQGWRRKR